MIFWFLATKFVDTCYLVHLAMKGIMGLEAKEKHSKVKKQGREEMK